MANVAVARVVALRRQIARIEGRLAETLDGSATGGAIVLRHGVVAARADASLATGVPGLDATLGGGLPLAALTEIHTRETRDAGASAGFALALAALMLSKQDGLLLWVGTTEVFREAGFPYAAGLAMTFGIRPETLLLAEAPRLLDALWVAEEAARLPAIACVVVEQRGNSDRLDLTATRRLHRRAGAAGQPVFLLRQGVSAEPTAAPVRFVVSPASAARRSTIAGPLPDSVGDLAFRVSVDRSPTAMSGQFVMEWKSHDLAFRETRPAHPSHMVPLPADGANLASAAGSVVAFPPAAGAAAPHRQPARGERAEDRGARRAG
ncbi:MAG: ImuA family protein [Rhizobiaceae bacterium]